MNWTKVASISWIRSDFFLSVDWMAIDTTGGNKKLTATLCLWKAELPKLVWGIASYGTWERNVAFLASSKFYLYTIKPCIPMFLGGNLYIEVRATLYKPKWKKQLDRELGHGQLYGIPLSYLICLMCVLLQSTQIHADPHNHKHTLS